MPVVSRDEIWNSSEIIRSLYIFKHKRKKEKKKGKKGKKEFEGEGGTRKQEKKCTKETVGVEKIHHWRLEENVKESATTVTK